ncbi:MAG TPA: Ig-like domain-containing protein, partial [Mycobacteriales bacterium]|nr:Ig-like domain-containing protein [Mycobacteriales bacterium]
MILGAHGMLPTPASAQTGGSTTLPGGGSLMVSISSPVGGTTVTGTITVAATVSTVGSVTVQGVQFKLDGVNLGAQDTTAPYSVPWDTKTATNASHTLTAVARDIVGIEYTSEPVTVTVFNDKTPPTVSITAPAAGATVSSTITVTASASDNVGVAGVQFKLDGANLGAESTVAPYTMSWDTTTATNASHTLTAVARDAAGNQTTSAAVIVTVSHDAAAPL